ITTLAPTDGADPQRVRAWLIGERGIVTTYAEVQRAPFEMTAPVLRVSPHVDTSAEDLDQFAEALAAATAQVGPSALWLSHVHQTREPEMTHVESDSAKPSDDKPKPPKRDRTHWLYMAGIVAVLAGVIAGLVGPEAGGAF